MSPGATLRACAQMRIREDLKPPTWRSRFPRPMRPTSHTRWMPTHLLVRLAARLNAEVVAATLERIGLGRTAPVSSPDL